MLEHTKKPLTDNVTLCFSGPASRRAEAVKLLVDLGFAVREREESAPWREAFPFKGEELPGVFLSGTRYREGLAQEALAKAAGIPRRYI